MAATPVEELRFADVITFLSVQRCGSITGAARALKVTPSQVSKAVVRLEEHLGVTLLSRSTRGVAVSDAGRRLTPQLEEIAARLRQLRPTLGVDRGVLTLAAPSYLTGLFMPEIATAIPELRLRGLELPPSVIRAYAGENIFDLTLTIGEETLPAQWVSTRLGLVRRALFAPPALARSLGPQPISVEKLAGVPFVSPVYNLNGQFFPVDDGCPLGHESHTIGLALELAARCGQVVYGPVIAARGYLDRGQLEEVRVVDWTAGEPLFLACNAERVLASQQREVVSVLSAALSKLDPQ